MNGIDAHVLHDAAKYVDECAQVAEIHTVTITLNGAHGGADVIIQGTVDDVRGGGWGDVEYVRTYQV